MSALRFSISLDLHDTRKLNSRDYVYIIGGPCIINPLSKLKHSRVSPLDTELSDISESTLPSDSDNSAGKPSVEKTPNFSGKFRKSKRNIWKSFHSVKKVSRDAGLKPNSHGKDKKGKKDQGSVLLCEGENANALSLSENSLDDDVGVIEHGLRIEQCNVILESLEGVSDGKALTLFMWMRNNGMLKRNMAAYKLALRVLGRLHDWNRAEILIQEMTTESGCELNIQVFNTLIYACHKQGLAELGTKWFHMMLAYRVQPNIATIGMLMSLYQKGSVVQEAEFTFSLMRNLKITCQNAYSAMITIYTRLGLYDKAEEVIRFLKEDEIFLNKENWLVLLNAYCQQGKLQKAERVLVAMGEAGFSPHIVAYNTMITGCGKILNMDAAQCLFQNLGKVGLEPDQTTYRSMIEGWGRVGNYKEAEWYYKELKHSGFKPNSSNLYTMINLQAEHGDEEGAIRTLNEMIMMDCQYSSVLGILVKAYEKAGKFDKVPSVLTGKFYEHVLINQTSCSILLMAYVKHNLVTDAIQVLKDKRWEDLAFEENLYHLLICSCKEMGHGENAIKIYTSMPDSSKPNLHIMSTMIDIYTVMNLFEEAENIYLRLKSSGVTLDIIAFSIIIRMYVKSGSLEKACSVLETMEERKDIVPDVYLLRDMLRIYQRLGMLDKLSELYYKILKSGAPLDQEMYNCIINCCARALPIDELSRIFYEMLQHGFTPNTITFNVMLNAYGRCRLFKKVRKVFWMAKKSGLADVVSYNTIIASYGKSEDFKNMKSAVKKMQFSGLSVSLEAYNCMLDAYGKKGEMEKFKDVLQRMKESSCAPDHYTYNTIINIYGEQGWIEEVANVLIELKESGLGLDLCSYNALIKAYGIAGMVEDAVALIKEMRENGLEPDTATYANLVTALRRNDMFLEAVRWSLWMKQMGL